MEYCLHESAVSPERSGGAEVRRLFDAATGCAAFDQRLLRFGADRVERPAGASDEVLYVLAGDGTIGVPGGVRDVTRGDGVFVAAGVPSTVQAGVELTVLSVLVHDPEPATAPAAFVSLAEGTTEGATAGRQFVLGVTPEAGCASVTQFSGFIPVGRAPDHFHRYDEVVYVLEGEGLLHIGGETASLRAGSSIHLPARLVHCLENTGTSEMRVLGVFRPAGSPAEAYYPDGTLAVVRES